MFVFSLLTSVGLAGGLDGRTFDVTLMDPNKTADTAKLVFAGDEIDVTGRKELDFARARYTATERPGGWKVTAEQVSPTVGKSRWVLTVTGEHIEGTMDWTRAEGLAPIRYVVSGSLDT